MKRANDKLTLAQVYCKEQCHFRAHLEICIAQRKLLQKDPKSNQLYEADSNIIVFFLEFKG